MLMRAYLVVFTLVILFCSSLFAAEPQRALGLSAHMLPKRVAEADRSKSLKWGFMVSTTNTASVPAKDRPVFQTAAELLTHFRSHAVEVQANGIWVVLTDPRAYSDFEHQVLADLKRMCREQGISLFVAQGQDLPNGWRRYSQLLDLP